MGFEDIDFLACVRAWPLQNTCYLSLGDDFKLAKVLAGHGPDGGQAFGDGGEGLNDDARDEMNGDHPPFLAVIEFLEQQTPGVDSIEGAVVTRHDNDDQLDPNCKFPKNRHFKLT